MAGGCFAPVTDACLRECDFMHAKVPDRERSVEEWAWVIEPESDINALFSQASQEKVWVLLSVSPFGTQGGEAGWQQNLRPRSEDFCLLLQWK